MSTSIIVIKKYFLFITFLIPILCCQANRAGIYLSMDGSFASADIIINGLKKTDFSYEIRTINGKTFINGKPSEDRSRKMDIIQNENNSLINFSLNPGLYKIILAEPNGNKIEIIANIKVGENYVHYDEEKKELGWNNDVYKVTLGEPVTIK